MVLSQWLTSKTTAVGCYPYLNDRGMYKHLQLQALLQKTLKLQALALTTKLSTQVTQTTEPFYCMQQ